MLCQDGVSFCSQKSMGCLRRRGKLKHHPARCSRSRSPPQKSWSSTETRELPASRSREPVLRHRTYGEAPVLRPGQLRVELAARGRALVRLQGLDPSEVACGHSRPSGRGGVGRCGGEHGQPGVGQADPPGAPQRDDEPCLRGRPLPADAAGAGVRPGSGQTAPVGPAEYGLRVGPSLQGSGRVAHGRRVG
jgi:hypothetical protein